MHFSTRPQSSREWELKKKVSSDFVIIVVPEFVWKLKVPLAGTVRIFIPFIFIKTNEKNKNYHSSEYFDSRLEKRALQAEQVFDKW